MSFTSNVGLKEVTYRGVAADRSVLKGAASIGPTPLFRAFNFSYAPSQGLALSRQEVFSSYHDQYS